MTLGRYQQPNQERALTTDLAARPACWGHGALASIEDWILETSKLFVTVGEQFGAVFKLLTRRGQAWKPSQRPR